MNEVEKRLAKLARGGDVHAFAELVELYKDKMYRLAYRMLGQAEDAEDVVQETFLRVFLHLNRYDDKQKFSTWIYRIAANLCIDRLRKRKPGYSLDAGPPRADKDGNKPEGYAFLPSERDLPEKELLLSETQEQIRDAIEALPEKYKTVVVLRYLHDLSLQEIGEVLDMPITTVKTRMHRGREYLRKKLEKTLKNETS